jgi:hypothetical protein
MNKRLKFSEIFSHPFVVKNAAKLKINIADEVYQVKEGRTID